MTQRIALLERRNIDDILRAVDYLNTTTHWVQSTATDAQLEEVTDTPSFSGHARPCARCWCERRPTGF